MIGFPVLLLRAFDNDRNRHHALKIQAWVLEQLDPFLVPKDMRPLN